MQNGKFVGFDRPSIGFDRPSNGVRSPLLSPLLSGFYRLRSPLPSIPLIPPTVGRPPTAASLGLRRRASTTGNKDKIASADTLETICNTKSSTAKKLRAAIEPPAE